MGRKRGGRFRSKQHNLFNRLDKASAKGFSSISDKCVVPAVEYQDISVSESLSVQRFGLRS